jgi:DNA-binding TFAR19-related protein (PDSD5 family)
MKLRSILANNHKKEFLVTSSAGREYSFPYARTEPKPSLRAPVSDVYVDHELGREAFTYILRSGDQGTVHFEQVLEYNEDPEYLADLLAYQLSLEAQRRLDASKLSRRQVARRLNTSVPQLYRLLDTANTTKSLKQLVALLHVLGCDVDLVVKKKTDVA